MKLLDIDNYLQAFNYISRSKIKINEINEILKEYKEKFVKLNNQILAKEVWIFKEIFFIQNSFFSAYDLLKSAYIFGLWIEKTIEMGNRLLRGKLYHKSFYYIGPNLETNKKKEDKLYEEIWYLLVDCELHLEFLLPHLNYNEDKEDKYFLSLISHQVEKLEILFPFKFFMSMGMTISERTCNICGKTIKSPRNECEHISGEIYYGNMCIKHPSNYREVHHVAMLPNPRDKKCIIFATEGRHYSYRELRYLISVHPSPFIRINYNWIDQIKDHWDKIYNIMDEQKVSFPQIFETLLE